MDAADETENKCKITGNGNDIEVDILSSSGCELKYMTIVSSAVK